MSETISEASFEQLADKELNQMLDALIDSGEAVDPDLESGVLSILFDDETKYVVNSHRAARQIWMAAERAAWHFDFDPAKKKWLTRQKGDELWSEINRVLSNKLGHSVTLKMPQ